MATHARIAARLLRDAATFFRNIGDENPGLKEQMHDNANVYDQVADLLDADPLGVVATAQDPGTTEQTNQ